MTIKFVNLTGKNLKVVTPDEDEFRIIPIDMNYARPYVPITHEKIYEVDGIDICRVNKAEVVNLPEPEQGTLFIVNKMVAERARRDDFVIPDRMVKNTEGGVLACRCFSKI